MIEFAKGESLVKVVVDVVVHTVVENRFMVMGFGDEEEEGGDGDGVLE